MHSTTGPAQGPAAGPGPTEGRGQQTEHGRYPDVEGYVEGGDIHHVERLVF